MDKPMTFNEWLGTQGNMVLLHANCCRIAYEAGQQSQQAKVEELQNQVTDLDNRATQYALDEMATAKLNGELQKRVDALELKLREVAGIARGARHGEYYTESGRNAGLNFAAQIEQALKGEGL